MKAKKGILAILAMLLVVSLVLAGCGGDNTDISGTIQQTQGTTPTQQETVSETAEQTQDTTPADAEERPLSIGKFEGGIYTNKYLGLGCNLDSNWLFSSAEELQTLPSGVADALEGTDLGEMMGEMTQILDMKADNVADLTTMNIMYAKLGLQERLGYLAMGEEKIIDAVLAQSDLMISSYEQVGIVVSEMKKVTVNFLGEEHYATWTASTVQGMNYYILQLYDYTAGEYGATITLGSYVEDNTSALLELFYKVD